jgi:hypothetical protein
MGQTRCQSVSGWGLDELRMVAHVTTQDGLLAQLADATSSCAQIGEFPYEGDHQVCSPLYVPWIKRGEIRALSDGRLS